MKTDGYPGGRANGGETEEGSSDVYEGRIHERGAVDGMVPSGVAWNLDMRSHMIGLEAFLFVWSRQC